MFYAAAHEGSYTRAAQALYVTQPAVSQSIRALEHYYGVPLFKKSGRSMELTHAGRLLYGYAQRVFALTDEAEQTLRELATAGRGELRVAANKIFARYLMPAIIASFRDRHPGVDLTLNEGGSEQMVASVERLDNHVAVVGRVPYPSRLRVQPFRRVELVLAAGAGHPLSHRTQVCLHDLEGEPLVIREQGSSSRLAVIERFAREGVGLKVAMESGSVDFIKEYVAEGRGLAFLYEPEIRAELESGRLVKIPLAGGGLQLQTDVVFLADAYRSPAVRAFLEVLEESATEAWEALKDPAG